jgi:hypothetical protein
VAQKPIKNSAFYVDFVGVNLQNAAVYKKFAGSRFALIHHIE